MELRATRKPVYLDYQASTPVDPRVLAAMAPFHTEFFANPHAADHALGWESNKATEIAAKQIAFAVNADSDEIIFTSGATEANNLALLGVAARAPSDRRRILVSAVEHKCVLAAAQAAARFECSVELLPVNDEGLLDLDALQRRLGDDVLLVSVMAVNNEIGTVQPIAEIGRRCRAVGAFFHTDAVHSLAAGSIDIVAAEIDLLSLSGHKIYGPKGIGALFIRRDVQRHLEPLFYGGGQQNGLRAGTLPVPLCVGFGVAATLLVGAEADAERARTAGLRDLLVEGLTLLRPGFRLAGPVGDCRHPGNANIMFNEFSAHDILSALQPRLAASSGSACTSGDEEPSHVLRAIGLSDTQARSCIRFGLGRFTSKEEIDEAVFLIDEALVRLS